MDVLPICAYVYLNGYCECAQQQYKEAQYICAAKRLNRNLRRKEKVIPAALTDQHSRIRPVGGTLEGGADARTPYKQGGSFQATTYTCHIRLV